jgi:hypothetical protein
MATSSALHTIAFIRKKGNKKSIICCMPESGKLSMRESLPNNGTNCTHEEMERTIFIAKNSIILKGMASLNAKKKS